MDRFELALGIGQEQASSQITSQSALHPSHSPYLDLVMIGVGVWKRMRPSYILYMFLTWGLAVSTSWWISVPRYIMAMFPMFMLLGALTKRKAVNIALVAVLGGLALLLYGAFCVGLVGILKLKK